MWILKDFINDTIIPLLPWALVFLGLVIFCAEFVWTDRKTLSEAQKQIIKSFFVINSDITDASLISITVATRPSLRIKTAKSSAG